MSAYVKLPLREPEQEWLRGALAEWDGYVSSALLATEAIRACGRYGSAYAPDAREWLRGVGLLPLDDSILDRAASLDPPLLRALDAVDLATALSVREDIGVLFTYDDRLAEAAKRYGMSVAGGVATR